MDLIKQIKNFYEAGFVLHEQECWLKKKTKHKVWKINYICVSIHQTVKKKKTK